MDDPFDLIGDVLDGQFRVDAFAGEGDLSIVYRGHHMGVDAPIAIKCLNLPATLDHGLIRPLIDSFREASRIHYRLARGNLNIAQSIASGTTLAPRTGTLVPYLVREWFEGESLASDLERRRQAKRTGRSVDETLSLLEAAFDGVGYAHAQNDVHLSINPSNLFVAKSGDQVSTKVLDFGVARAMNDLVTGIPAGNRPDGGLRVLFPAYAAPEQLDRSVGELGPPTDVYALALITMEVLSDRVVMFEHEAAAVTERALDERRRPTPQAHGLKIPRNLEFVLARAVSRAPEKRHKNAHELWRELKSALRTTASVKSMAATFSAKPSPARLGTAADPEALAAAQEVSSQPVGASRVIPQPAGSSPVVPQPAGSSPVVPQPAGSSPRIPQPAGSSPTIAQAAGSSPTFPNPAAASPMIPQRPRSATLMGMGAVVAPPQVAGAIGKSSAGTGATVETNPMAFVPPPPSSEPKVEGLEFLDDIDSGAPVFVSAMSPAIEVGPRNRATPAPSATQAFAPAPPQAPAYVPPPVPAFPPTPSPAPSAAAPLAATAPTPSTPPAPEFPTPATPDQAFAPYTPNGAAAMAPFGAPPPPDPAPAEGLPFKPVFGVRFDPASFLAGLSGLSGVVPRVRKFVRRQSPRTLVAAAFAVVGTALIVVTIAIIISLHRHPLGKGAAAAASSACPAPVVVPAPPPAVAPPPPPAPPPVPTVQRKFNRYAARRSLDALSGEAMKCRRDQTWGTAFATVSFNNDGSVSSVGVGPPFTNTPAGECVAQALGAAHVPSFGGRGVFVYQFFIAPN